MSQEKLIIGTRGSALALKQVDITAHAIHAVDPSISIEVKIIETHGDVNQNPIPLDTVGKGWFTKEIEQALLSGEIHLAVHSLKDMAEDMPAGLHIGAYLAREDARDVLVTKHGESLEELLPGAIIGTDSARRQVQMLALQPDVEMHSLRGNVLTRLEKLSSGNYDAIILASAGLKRLGLQERIVRYFAPDEMTPSPGQGILALQTKEDDTKLQTLLATINDADAASAAGVERAFSRAVGGGCKSPTGAYAWRVGGECRAIGMLVNSLGVVVRAELTAPWDKTQTLGEDLAKKLLGNG